MQKIITNYHRDVEQEVEPLVSDLRFDAKTQEWVIPHPSTQAAPPAPKIDVVPRVGAAGKNIVLGLLMVGGYGALIVIEVAGRVVFGVGEFIQILWLSSRRPTQNAPERQEKPLQREKIKVEVNVKIEA